MNIYLFSGLGADERLFRNLKPIPGYTYVPVPFVPPASAKTLADYGRLMISAHNFKTPCIFAGVSIGGMIAQEVAQIIKPEKLVLISTIQFRDELPELFKWANNGFVKALLNKPVLELIAAVGDKFTIKSPEGRELFYSMLRDADGSFMKFGAGVVMDWDPPKASVSVIRIHGTADRVFPVSGIKDTIKIIGGNHFMIYERGQEIAEVLQNAIQPLETRSDH